MGASSAFALALVLCAPMMGSTAGVSITQKQQLALSANPIRKVVTMLQVMQKKVEAEGAAETELYDKYMCYCKTSGGTLKDSIAAAESKVTTLGPELNETISKHAQAKEALKTAQEDRIAAKAAIKDAEALRAKQAAEFAKEKAESDGNIAAITAAVAALEKGLAGFLQTNSARFLKKLVLAEASLAEYDRDEVVSFLSGGEDSPGTGEVIGILKQMKETMEKGLAEATEAEKAALEATKELIAAKTKELAALQETIEAKMGLIGDLGVQSVEIENDLASTKEQAAEDAKFLADMEANCATKTSEHEENQKLRGQELVALADTIKILNDDDALDLFKKTLPSASSSLLQLTASPKALRKAALAKLAGVRRHGGKGRLDLSFIALAIMGKKTSFAKVITMIDNMVVEIGEEQKADDAKKEYCETQIEETDTKVATLKKSISDLETATETLTGDLSTVTADIKALGTQIKDLDKAMAEATAQRKEESKVYSELMASDAAAKELLEFAMNRLNKFYNPILFKAPPTTTLNEMDTLYAEGLGTAAAFVQISEHTQSEVAPPPPPETAEAYKEQRTASTGVIQMIKLLIKDLAEEMDQAEEDEKMAQKEYEHTAKDCMEQRQMYSKTLVEKESAKAEMETSLQTHKEDTASSGEELMATEEYLAGVHNECDWLLKYFATRAEARVTEIEALKNAKAVLSGADYSLVQTSSQNKHLRGRM